MTAESKEEILKATEEKMNAEGLHSLCVRTFSFYLDQLIEGASGFIGEDDIDPLDEVKHFEELDIYHQKGIELLGQTVMVKLNGGLGTSMGLDKAKSLLPARGDATFMDLVIRQVTSLRARYNVGLPLICMNSFRTDEDTRPLLEKNSDFMERQGEIPVAFLQNKVPKVLINSLLPASWPEDPSLEWCPPGHGDIYSAMIQTGILQQLLDKDYRYAFFSNADNLGAILSPLFPGFMEQEGYEFIMEAAVRTAADKKGGHLARAKDGRLLLREKAQAAPEDNDEFQNISRYRYFNTNSLWIYLPALQRLMEETDGIPGLPLIRNEKSLDPRDPESPGVYQLETAMGTAISCFEKAAVIEVPRTRFAPVKTTNDLLDLWSDNFIDTREGEVLPNPEKIKTKIVINLDERFYKKIDDFESRFPYGAPSLATCTSFTVQGDIEFGKNVTLTGDIFVCNQTNKRAYVPDNSVLTGEIFLNR